MRQILRPFRFIGVVILLAVYLTRMGIGWLIWRHSWQNLRRSNRLLSFYCRVALFLLSVRPKVIGLEETLEALRKMNPKNFEVGAQANARALFVGNHLSYIDIIVFSSHLSTCFVTSNEIKETPVLGHLCRSAGCLFVERRNRRNLQNEISEVGEGLKKGLTVTVFPESTSTNGEQLLRFRKGLFVSAIQAEAPVVPFTLNYRKVGGEPINKITRDTVFWYGDMDFVSHLWSACANGGVEVELTFAPPIVVNSQTDPVQLATLAQEAVEKNFMPLK